MPREEGPIELRSTVDLRRRFDFITSNSRVVREAIECVFILQELGRREAAAEAVARQRQAARMTPANEGTNIVRQLDEADRFTDAVSPQTAAGENPPDAAGDGNNGGPHGAAG